MQTCNCVINVGENVCHISSDSGKHKMVSFILHSLLYIGVMDLVCWSVFFGQSVAGLRTQTQNKLLHVRFNLTSHDEPNRMFEAPVAVTAITILLFSMDYRRKNDLFVLNFCFWQLVRYLSVNIFFMHSVTVTNIFCRHSVAVTIQRLATL
jgi:hypothetical protein